MKKILYLLFFISFASFGQSGNVKLNTNINNTKTNKHVNISGTRIYIIPPPNYKVSIKGMSLDAMHPFFHIYDEKLTDFNSEAIFRSNERLKSEGITVLDTMRIMVNGYTGIFHLTAKDTSFKIYDLIFGEKDLCGIITVSIPHSMQSEMVDNEIIQVLNSVYFDKNKKEAAYETSCFALNDSASAFKFFEFNNGEVENRYEYKVREVNYDNSLKFLSVVAIEEVMKESDSSNIKIFVERKVKEMSENEQRAIIKKSITTIGNNYEAFQLDINGEIEKMNVTSKVYFIKSNNNIVTLALGMMPSKNFEYYIKEFNKLANTIRFK